MCTSGSGGFLKSLHKYGVLKILEKTDIEVVNLVSTKDLNPRIADPKLISLLTECGNHRQTLEGVPNRPTTSCIVDVTERKSTYLIFPTILQEEDTGRFDFYYPDQSLKIMKRERGLVTDYELLALNMFFTLKHLKYCLSKHTADVFRYRQKRKNVKIYNTKLDSAYVDGGLGYFSFELSAFNLFNLSEDSLIAVKPKHHSILYLNEPGAPVYSEKYAVKKLMRLIDKKVEALDMEPGK